MDATEALATVSDRLVGGVMHHSDHADLCWHMGLEEVARMNEAGYRHDSKCLRRVRKAAIRNLGSPLPESRQDRSHLLDAHRREPWWELGPQARQDALRTALGNMAEWEEGTCAVLRRAHESLLARGQATLSDLVWEILADTEGELAGIREACALCETCGWDVPTCLETLRGRD